MTLGWQEIALLAVFALIVFGPKRLPDIARQVGRFVAEVRRVSRDFQREVRDVTEPVEREIREAERVARRTYDLDPDHSIMTGPPKPPKDDRTGAE